MKTRLPHQVHGARFIAERQGGGLFMGMRTGKTLTAWDSLAMLQAFPVLIICPVSVMASWVGQLLEEGVPRSAIVTVRQAPGRKLQNLQNLLVMPRPSVFLLNFEMVRKLDALHIRRKLCRGAAVPDWRAVVVDESYRIANWEASVTDYLLRWPKPPQQIRLCLSGAPAPEAPYNLATQMIFCTGSWFGCISPQDYMARFWTWNEWRKEWAPAYPAHLEEIQAELRRWAFTISMDCLGLGGMKQHEVQEVPATPLQLELFEWLRTATVYPDKKGELRILSPLVRVTFEQKTAAGVHPITGACVSREKIRHVLQSWADRPRPLLVLSRFRSPLQYLQEDAQAAGLRIATITGDTSTAEREEIRQRFQAGQLDMVGAQVRTVKMGLDFSSLDSIFYLSNSFSQDDRAQSEDRGNHVHRRTPYGVVTLATTGSLDRRVNYVLTRKGADAILYIRFWNSEILKGSAYNDIEENG